MTVLWGRWSWWWLYSPCSSCLPWQLVDSSSPEQTRISRSSRSKTTSSNALNSISCLSGGSLKHSVRLWISLFTGDITPHTDALWSVCLELEEKLKEGKPVSKKLGQGWPYWHHLRDYHLRRLNVCISVVLIEWLFSLNWTCHDSVRTLFMEIELDALHYW